jgi:hypothetical protein
MCWWPKGYRPVDRDQGFLLPPNLRDWLPAGHWVWFVLDVVDQLDLSALDAVSKRTGAGRAGYHPDALVADVPSTRPEGTRRMGRLYGSHVAF